MVENVLQLIGTFLPIIGVAVTAVLAARTSGRQRWIVLVALPALTLGSCFALGEWIARDGNLLFVALLMLLYVLLIVYYPVLVVIGIKQWLERRNAA